VPFLRYIRIFTLTYCECRNRVKRSLVFGLLEVSARDNLHVNSFCIRIVANCERLVRGNEITLSFLLMVVVKFIAFVEERHVFKWRQIHLFFKSSSGLLTPTGDVVGNHPFDGPYCLCLQGQKTAT